jgi:hypothetical protein
MKFFILSLIAALGAIFAPRAALGITIRDGVGHTQDGNQDRRPLHWFDGLRMLDPELTPFTQLLMNLDKVTVSDPKFNHFEDDDRPAKSNVNNGAGYDDNDTSIVVDDGTIFAEDYRAIVSRTGEVLQITGVSSNTLTVTRGAIGSTAAAINDNDEIMVLGNRVYEGDTLPSLKTTIPTTLYNYVQEFREPYGISGTSAATSRRGGPNDLERERVIAMREFKKQVERALRFSKRYQSGTGTSIERATGGFEYWVTTNLFNVQGQLSKPDLMRIIEATSRYGSKKKLWLCGREARLQIDALGLEGVNVSAKDNVLGIDITKVKTSFAEVNLVTDHLLSDGFGDRIHIVDPTKVKMAVLQGRGIRHMTNRQAPDYDGVKNEFMATVGLFLETEKAHGIVKGIIPAVS